MNLNVPTKTAVSPPTDPSSAILFAMPQSLEQMPLDFQFSPEQQAALNRFMMLRVDADPDESLAIVVSVVAVLADAIDEIDVAETAVQRAQKFSTYDDFFNIQRTTQQNPLIFLHSLFLTYANALKNLKETPHTLTCIELPLLHVAIESILGLFSIGAKQ